MAGLTMPFLSVASTAGIAATQSRGELLACSGIGDISLTFRPVCCRRYHYHFTGPLGPFPQNPTVKGYPYMPGCFKVGHEYLGLPVA
jgi:hypothetical protein